MMIAVPPGNNIRIHGKSQGFKGLPVHHEDRPLADNDGNLTGEIVHVLRTAWTPTPEELAKLNAGANIIMEEWANLPSPRMMFIGDVPD